MFSRHFLSAVVSFPGENTVAANHLHRHGVSPSEAALAGAALEIAGAPGRGTEVTVREPVRTEPKDAPR